MLKRVFLSIIILSALTSEGSNYYTANLIDYYLKNFTYFEMVQDSTKAVSVFAEQNLQDRKGIPVSFFKKLSQDTINSKSPNADNSIEFWFVFSLSIVLFIYIIAHFLQNKKFIINAKRTLLCRADSSPPAYC